MGSKLGRKRNDWKTKVTRQVAKMLSAVIRDREIIDSKSQGESKKLHELYGSIEKVIWDRIHSMYGPVSKMVIGTKVELQTVLDEMEQESGLKVTPHHLYDRAHKTTDYSNERIPLIFEKVEKAYLEIVNGRDSRRIFSKTQKNMIYFLYEGKCADCGIVFPEDEMEYDHKEPHSRGGRTTVENAQPMCKECHKSKGDMSWEEWKNH
jgi:hypothetical protein